jgi:Tat protein translocase TatB subunit
VDFLNVGPWELIVVLIIAILVAGPKRMVEIARTLGQFSRQLRDMSREFTMALQSEIQATEEEAGKAGVDLREVQRDLEDVLSGSPQQREPDADGGSDALDESEARTGEEA